MATSRSRPSPDSRRGRGARTERRAAWLYRLRGYRILATNLWIGGYELDLVARRGRRLVFVEVKGKSGRSWGDPLEMVDREKQRRIRRAAEGYVARNPELAGLRMSFEVVAERAGRLERVRDAF
jgi:putative endonuclease